MVHNVTAQGRQSLEHYIIDDTVLPRVPYCLSKEWMK